MKIELAFMFVVGMTLGMFLNALPFLAEVSKMETCGWTAMQDLRTGKVAPAMSCSFNIGGIFERNGRPTPRSGREE